MRRRLNRHISGYARATVGDIASETGGALRQAVRGLAQEVADHRNKFPGLLERTEHLERVADAIFRRVIALEGAYEKFSGEITNHVSQLYVDFRRDMDHDAKRIDYVLGEMEGLGIEREAFQAARRTPEYRSAFLDPEPLVSVCVSTHNRADLLIERCLSSLIAQSYRNLQIIVVGDHCTDDTEARIRELGDPRIEFHNLPRPSVYPAPGIDRWRVAGTVPANVAREKARGAFISHLDDDDSSDSERFAVLVEAARTHEADFLWHKALQETPEGEWVPFGNGTFKLAQINLGMCMYHRYFARLGSNVYAYRVDEPGDWNAMRRIAHLRPKLHFIDRALTRYYALPRRPPFVLGPNEVFLD
ncbi:glycosyltransferase family 2 protein [Ancylobacter pratisalsi]|uniref:Glycosyltransferase family 2 protein n=1 Tax=Ancylobacter pratisalsi TaxID=1745854 RepID=A0A6P1YMA6_9HYPH|nr:glycosyltransferase family 2 protein [Ancylobacter pratisalsi]QIB34488.1 glycosyltransferase family 2 protein [Ancylobacter pratisalsi]